MIYNFLLLFFYYIIFLLHYFSIIIILLYNLFQSILLSNFAKIYKLYFSLRYPFANDSLYECLDSRIVPF